MNIASSFLLLLLAATLAGCSTTPMKLSEASPIPPQHIYQYVSPTKDSGHLIIYRESGVVGSACEPDIYLNGTDVADSLADGMRLDLFPPPATYVLSMHSFCGNSTIELPVTVKAGETNVFEMGMRHGSFILLPVQEPSAH